MRLEIELDKMPFPPAKKAFYFSIGDRGIRVFDKEHNVIAACEESNAGASAAALIVQALNNELTNNPTLTIRD